MLKTDSDKTGAVIDDILSIRNKVPGTAERGTGGGQGESKYSGSLETVESALRTDSWNKSWDEDTVSEQCRYYVWRLLDYAPAEPESDEDRAVIATKIITHYKSIMSAYPKVERWLNGREDYFSTYLEAHRDDAGMPLKGITPKELTKILKLVQDGL